MEKIYLNCPAVNNSESKWGGARFSHPESSEGDFLASFGFGENYIEKIVNLMQGCIL